MQTVVELPSFLHDVEGTFSDKEREELKAHLAKKPRSGVVIQGTGGLRKIRWGAKGKGTRSGSRTIYFHHDSSMPIFLLAIFTKGEKTDLTSDEKKQMSKATKALKENYGRRS